MKILILAGGNGSRLRPISRKYYPKQFIQLKEFGFISFFQQTLKRALKITNKKNIIIIANEDYKFHCLNQANEIGISLDENQIILEPCKKNTLGAICLGIDKFQDKDAFLVLPSDHVIGDDEIFANEIRTLEEDAQKHILIFGIKPVSPNTGYGYINFGKSKEKISKVADFKEKPDGKTAQKYVKKGYYWNSGILLFSKKIFLEELKKSDIQYFNLIKKGVLKNFESLPDISVDYGILEKSDNIYIKTLDIYWNDLGSRDAFKEYLSTNQGNILEIESKNNFSISESDDKKIVFIGTQDLIAIDTKDALLIAKGGTTQKTKKAVETLQKNDSGILDFGKTVYRPWGSYTIIDGGVGFQTKRISVLPGKKLSLQMHHHRSEHWVVVSGTATITLGTQTKLVKKGESIYIPLGEKHRLENEGKTILHIIESQIGDYLEEDDIIRFDDDFGRIK